MGMISESHWAYQVYEIIVINILVNEHFRFADSLRM